MLTTREVGERLDVNPGQVRGWCINGDFPNAIRHETGRGPIWYIPESDLQGFRRRAPGRPPKFDGAGGSPPSKRKEARFLAVAKARFGSWRPPKTKSVSLSSSSHNRLKQNFIR